MKTAKQTKALLVGLAVWTTCAWTAPLVTSVSPISGQRGATLTATLTGSGFVSGATVSFGSGVTVNAVTFNSSTSLSASITISSSASLGFRVITVTNPDNSSATLSNNFQVTAGAPSVSSVSPSNGAQGQTLSVSISGQNFQNGAVASFGAGITVNSTTFNSTTSLTAGITISPSASTGVRSPVVTNPDGLFGVLNNGFTVTAAPPTITSLSPAQGVQGSTLTITVTGSGFQSGATATFSSSITVNSISVDSATQITLQVAIASNALAGARDLTITNPDSQSATLNSAFTVLAPAPAITSIAPTQGAQGTTATVTITGANFQNGATVSFGAGITVNSTTFTSSTALSASITIAADASLGTRDVVVTNPDSQSATLSGGFTVLAPAPTVTSISPTSGVRGQTLNLTLTGTDFQLGATVSLGAGVTVNGVVFNSASQLVANVSIDSAATLGARDVTVTNPDTQSGVLSSGFTVTAPAPTVTAVSPNQGGQGASQSVAVTGTNFQSGATASFGAGITVNSVTFDSATQLTVSLTIDPAATLGARDVTVTNPDTQSATLTSGFTVLSPAPTLTAVSPTVGGRGATVSATLTGTGFQTGATVSFGADITIVSTTVNSATQIAVSLTISPTAALGARSVSVTNPDNQSAVLANAFTVSVAAPTVTSVSPALGSQGETLVVTVSGANFQSGATAGFGAGITVNSTSFNSSAQLVVNLTIDSAATLGARDVTITNPDTQTGVLASGFQVTAASPSITSVSPNRGGQGQTLTVVIGGQNFQSGATVSFGAGVTVNSVTFDSSSQLTTSIAIDTAATLGARDVTVTNPDSQQATSAAAFQITAPPPTVSSVSPNTSQRGVAATIVITGANFQSGATVSFGAGIAVTSVTFNSSTQLTAGIIVASGASTGARDVTVTNADAQSGTLTGGFIVVGPAPVLSAVTPNSGQTGATLDVLLAGQNFQSGATVDFGAGVTVNSVTFNSASQLTANITVAGNATTGARTVTVTNPDTQTTSLASGFTVTAPPPILTGISPTSATQGQTLTVTITGANFQSGATVALGAGVTVNSVTFDSASQLTVSITIATTASAGTRDLTVTNPDSQSSTLAGAFTITAPAPTVSSITPNQAAVGQTVSVVIAGANFVSGAAADFGAGVTVDSVTFDSSAQLTVNLTIAANATPGARNVTVTNPDSQSAVVPSGFTVIGPPPVVNAVTPTSVAQGATVTVTIDGADFQNGATVTLGSGVTINSVTFVSSAQLTASITVDVNAAVGPRSLTVTNPDSQSGTLANAITVGDGVPPVLSACTATQNAPDSIAVTFNEDVNSTDVVNPANYAIVVGTTVIDLNAATLSYQSASFTVTISGAGVVLPSGSAFAVRVTGVRDVAGNAIADNGVTNVCAGTVGDSAPPTVAGCAAGDANPDVVTVTFSENVQSAGATTANNFAVTQNGAPVSLGGAVLTYDPATFTTTITGGALGIVSGGAVSVRVTGVQDAAGNAIIDNGSTNVCSATAGDATPPTIAPCTLAQTSATASVLTITFSEDVQVADAQNAANYTLHVAGSPVTLTGATLTYDSGTHIVTITGLNIAAGQSYQVIVANVRDLSGNAIVAGQGDTCSGSVLDQVPPTVTGCSAAQTGSGKLAVTFSEDVVEVLATNPANYALTQNGQPVTLAGVSASYNATTFTITFTGAGLALTTGSSFTVTVTGVNDLAGNAVPTAGGSNVCSGAVADEVPPTVTACTAAQTGSGTVTVTFSESVQQADAENAGNYAIVQTGLPLSLGQATVTYDAGTRTATLVGPQLALTAGSTVTVTVSNVRDTAGNAIVSGQGDACSAAVSDAVGPRVINCISGQIAAGVGFVSATFSESVQTADAQNAANYTVTVSGQPLNLSSATIAYDDGLKTTLIGGQGVQVAAGDQVQVTVQNVRDLQGNVVDPANNTCQTTAIDQAPPTVAGCAAGVNGNSGFVRVRFSENVQQGAAESLPNYTVTHDGQPLDLTGATAAYDSGTLSVTISGAGVALTVGKQVSVTVINVQDVAGNTIANDGASNTCVTTVGDQTPPSISSCTATQTSLTICFSESVTGADQLSAYVIEHPTGQLLPPPQSAAVTYDSQTNCATISGLTLTPGQTFQVTILGVTDIDNNGLTSNTCSGTVPAQECSFAAGVNSVTIPSVYTGSDLGTQTLSAMFGSGFLGVATWDGAAFTTITDGAQAASSALPPDRGLSTPRGVGEGFFLNLGAPATVSLPGAPLDGQTDFTGRELPANAYALFGNPWFGKALDWTKMQYVFSNLQPANLSELWTTALGGGGQPIDPWGWTVENGSRFLVADTSAASFLSGISGVRTQVKACQSLWVRTRTSGVKLVAPTSSQTTQTASVRRARSSDDGWASTLVASLDNGATARAYFGATAKARGGLQVEAPPIASSGIDVAFTGSPRPLGVDIRGAGATTWQFDVVTARGGVVTLSWPDLNNSLPKEWRLRLVDLDGGARRSMRTTSSYSFTAEGEGPLHRRFRLEMTPASQGQVRITAATARVSNQGLVVRYTLTNDASVQVRVLTPSGRTVALLPTAVASRGVNAMVWDLRDAGGRRAPRGVYLVEISARDDEGRAARAVTAAAVQ